MKSKIKSVLTFPPLWLVAGLAIAMPIINHFKINNYDIVTDGKGNFGYMWYGNPNLEFTNKDMACIAAMNVKERWRKYHEEKAREKKQPKPPGPKLTKLKCE